MEGRRRVHGVDGLVGRVGREREGLERERKGWRWREGACCRLCSFLAVCPR